MYSGISVDWSIVWVKTEDIERKFEHFKIFAVHWKTCWWKNSGDNNSLRLKTVELLNVKQWRFYDTTDWAQPPTMNINVLLWAKYYNKKTTQASTKNTSWLFWLEVHLKLVLIHQLSARRRYIVSILLEWTWAWMGLLYVCSSMALR